MIRNKLSCLIISNPQSLNSCMAVKLLLANWQTLLRLSPTASAWKNQISSQVLRAEQLEVLSNLGRCRYQDRPGKPLRHGRRSAVSGPPMAGRGEAKKRCPHPVLVG